MGRAKKDTAKKPKRAKDESTELGSKRGGNKRRKKEVAKPRREKGRPLLARVRGYFAALWARVRGPLILIAKATLTVALIAGAIAVARLTEEYVRTSAAFAIKSIEVEGGERITDDALIEAAGLSVGANVFEVPPEDAQARLERHPWVASAHVTRRLPGSIAIQVQERRPVAVLALESLYLIGDDGTVFKQVTIDDPVDLPVVTGVDAARFARDRAFRTSMLLDVVALMHDYRGAGLWRREPIGADATQVRLGEAPFRGKLRKLRRILDRLRTQEARAHYVYLDNERRPDRVTVRLRE